MADRFVENLTKPLLKECFPSQHLVIPETKIESPQVGPGILKVVFLGDIQPLSDYLGIAALHRGGWGLEQSCCRLEAPVVTNKAGETLGHVPIQGRPAPEGGMVVGVGAPETADHPEATKQVQALLSEARRGLLVHEGRVPGELPGQVFLAHGRYCRHAELLEEDRFLCEPLGHRGKEGQGAWISRSLRPGEPIGVDVEREVVQVPGREEKVQARVRFQVLSSEPEGDGYRAGSLSESLGHGLEPNAHRRLARRVSPAGGLVPEVPGEEGRVAGEGVQKLAEKI